MLRAFGRFWKTKKRKRKEEEMKKRKRKRVCFFFLSLKNLFLSSRLPVLYHALAGSHSAFAAFFQANSSLTFPRPQPSLDGKHAIFGRVKRGMKAPQAKKVKKKSRTVQLGSSRGGAENRIGGYKRTGASSCL